MGGGRIEYFAHGTLVCTLEVHKLHAVKRNAVVAEVNIGTAIIGVSHVKNVDILEPGRSCKEEMYRIAAGTLIINVADNGSHILGIACVGYRCVV